VRNLISFLLILLQIQGTACAQESDELKAVIRSGERSDEEWNNKMKNFNVPPVEYTSPTVRKANTYKSEEKGNENESNNNIPASEVSHYNVEMEVKEIQAHPPAESVSAKANTFKYQKGQEEFMSGVYGYNPYVSLEENRRFYKSNGYTISY
jgi:hypothetical protein